MSDFTVFFIIIGMSAIQYFMATRNNFIFGTIMPVIFIVMMTWIFATDRIDSMTMYIVLLLVGLILLIEEWIRGRKTLHKRRQKEMDIMKTKDL